VTHAFDDNQGAALPSDTPAEFLQVWPKFFTADYFAAKASLMSSLYTHLYDSADHHRLGTMPLVVLSIEHPWHIASPAGERPTPSYGKIWNSMHQDLARLSSRGVHWHTYHKISWQFFLSSDCFVAANLGCLRRLLPRKQT
jgi:hypothetical protein